MLLQQATFLALVLAACAQGNYYYNQVPQQPPQQQQSPPQLGPREDVYADSAPESLIPSIAWPEWLPPDLASVPGNLPRPGQWAPPPRPGPPQGNPPPPQGQPNASPFGGLFGGPAPAAATGFQRRYPKGDPRNCIDKSDDTQIMQVVPGLGWDNLRNVETGMVVSFSYSQCKVTNDRKYLIPDQTFAIPIKTSNVERNSEFIENWDSYKSVTSRSVNTGFDFFGRIGGKFSSEFLDVKSRMFNEKAVTVRTELRYEFHSVKQVPDSKLHPSFKGRLLDIMSLLKSNDTESADYITELLVRDYGTHYLTSVDSGAVLLQQDSLKNTIKAEYNGQTNSITAAGGVEFFKFLRASGGYSSNSGQTDLSSYRRHITSSHVTSFGGPPYRMGMNLTEWQTNLINNLVAVDRTGRPLHSVITTENMKPEVISSAEVIELKSLVQAVVNRYYAFNTHLGCTDVKAPNFDYEANAPFPGACDASSRNYTFGGVFQSCISKSPSMCKSLSQKNPITGGYTCPSGYNPILLLSGSTSRPKTIKNCEKVKKCTFFIFNCRREDKCRYSQTKEYALHHTFWCAPKKSKQPPRTGYLFGGIYSKDMNNPVTRAKTCPNHYISLKIGTYSQICLSEDYELGQQYSLPFGGFFSCLSGNRLADPNNTSDFTNNPRGWPMKCPQGFTQHLAFTDNTCRVNFCTKAGVLVRATDLDIVLPPFGTQPGMKENSTLDMFEAVDPDNAFREEYSQQMADYVRSMAGANVVATGAILGGSDDGDDSDDEPDSGLSVHHDVSFSILATLCCVLLTWA